MRLIRTCFSPAAALAVFCALLVFTPRALALEQDLGVARGDSSGPPPAVEPVLSKLSVPAKRTTVSFTLSKPARWI